MKLIKQHVSNVFAKLAATGNLLTTAVPSGMLYKAYLNAIPESERTQYICRKCETFINNFGNIVTVIGGEIHTIWDFETDDPTFKDVPKAMADIVKSYPINTVFVAEEQMCGTDFNVQKLPGALELTWEHFSVTIPTELFTNMTGLTPGKLSQLNDRRNVFKRSLDEFTLEAVNEVLRLIKGNELLRGDTFLERLDLFGKHKVIYDTLSDDKKELFTWEYLPVHKSVRVDALDTLLEDLSFGDIDGELEDAVARFESKVNGDVYLTQKTEQELMDEIAELQGIESV